MSSSHLHDGDGSPAVDSSERASGSHQSGVHAVHLDQLSGMVLHDRFRLDKPFARGGMSVLYRATQIPLGRTVAVKLMTAPNMDGDQGARDKRFLREAQAAARLKHPNTITLHDYGYSPDGFYFIVMEYLEGRTLTTAIREDGPFTPGRAVAVGLQICGSLAEAHELGLVHRDLKPPNVFLTHLGGNPDHVKVLDFGLVKIVGNALAESEAWQTRAGVLLGTPAYMAPEQIVDEEIDLRTDIYSFGALMFHVLTGKPPFFDRSDYKILHAHVRSPVPALRDKYADCQASPELEAVVRRCMEKEARDRYASMNEVAEALMNCEAEQAQIMRDSGWIVRPASGSWSIPVRRSSTGGRRAVDESVDDAQAAPTVSLAQPAQAAPTASPAQSEQAAPARASAPVTVVPGLDPAQEPTADLSHFDLAPASRRWGGRLAVLVVLAVLAGLVIGLRRVVDTTAVLDKLWGTEEAEQSPSTPAPAPASASAKQAASATRTVAIESSPTGAQVTRDGKLLGTTPLEVEVSADAPAVFELSLEGHGPRTVEAPPGQARVEIVLVPTRSHLSKQRAAGGD
ncbi:serine/threonine-protein kinase [Haliangium sp.]|uniref:serine/threonine-protein kinase n=1 Tax=Haliangium sp. TaxID=2663208 RepID=UPI003D0FEB22